MEMQILVVFLRLQVLMPADMQHPSGKPTNVGPQLPNLAMVSLSPGVRAET